MPLVMSRADLNALPTSCRKAAEPLPFKVLAYAFGQFCLPYRVKVSHRRPRGMSLVGAI